LAFLAFLAGLASILHPHPFTFLPHFLVSRLFLVLFVILSVRLPLALQVFSFLPLFHLHLLPLALPRDSLS
jgi:hypothetical protein